jgi:hypothetical protein
LVAHPSFQACALKYASGLKKYRMSSLGQYLPKIGSVNDFVFLLTPFKEKAADESCVMSSTTPDFRAVHKPAKAGLVRQLENAVFLYARNCWRCDAPMKIKIIIRSIGVPVV